ncbi:MAG: ATP-dependent protease subunit HslV [Armatimonadota bacterium]
MKSTTILALRHNGMTAIAGDGQVTLDKTVMKHNAKKIRRLYNDKVICGFAGSAADGLTLFDKFEKKLEEFGGNLVRSAVELAKDWRTDKVLRRLEALLIVADAKNLLILSGTGDVIDPDDAIAAIGSGGPYAQAAAKALIKHSNLTADQIAKEALTISSEICIYTNEHITVETL